MASVKVERPPITAVTLKMTEEEAVAVAAALGRGPAAVPFFGPYRALAEAGLGYGHPRYADLRGQVEQ